MTVGPQGDQGERGEPGTVSWRVVAAFVAVAAVATIVLGYVYRDAQRIRALTNENRDAIRRVSALERDAQAFRAVRARQTAEADVLICRQVNEVKATIRQAVVPTRKGLLRIAYYRDHPGQIQAAIDAGRAVADRFTPLNCQHLPSKKHLPKKSPANQKSS